MRFAKLAHCKLNFIKFRLRHKHKQLKINAQSTQQLDKVWGIGGAHTTYFGRQPLKAQQLAINGATAQPDRHSQEPKLTREFVPVHNVVHVTHVLVRLV